MRVEAFSQVAHTGPARMTHSRRWALSRLREVRTVYNRPPANIAELKKLCNV
jgi:hypothetical protein